MLIICARCARRNAIDKAQCEACESPLALTLATRMEIDGEEYGLAALLADVPALRRQIAALQAQQTGEIAPQEAQKIAPIEIITAETEKVEPQEQAPQIREQVPTQQAEPTTEPLPRILQRDFVAEARGQGAEVVAALLLDVERAVQLAQATHRWEHEERLFAQATALEDLLTHLRAQQAQQSATEQQEQQAQENMQQLAAEQQMEAGMRAKIMMLQREMGELEDAIRRAQRAGNKETEMGLRSRLKQAEMRLQLLRAGKTETSNSQTEQPQQQRTTSEQQPATQQKQQQERPVKERTKIDIKPAAPSAFEVAVGQFFAPLRAASAFVSRQYEQAKAQQRLPLFFMTLAGIVILLFGLGFLVQYSANTWFGNLATQAKAGVGFAAGLAVLGVGMYLERRDTEFKLFGTALMGLAVSINYLLVYYLSSTAAVAAAWGFGLIALNSLFSSALAVWYRSGLIATLGLVAGAFSPLYLQQTGASPMIYFGYLWLLCLSAVATAQHFRWAALPVVSWLLSTVILLFSVYRNVWLLPVAQYMWAVVALFQAFAYLHWAAAMLQGFRWRERQDAFSLSLLSAGALVLAVELFALLGNGQLGGAYMGVLALLYAANALPFVLGLALVRGRGDVFLNSALLLIGAFFVGAAVFSYFDATRWGLLLGLESLLVLGLALMLNLRTVQAIASAGLAMSVLLVMPTFAQIGQFWQERLWTQGFVNFLFVGAMLAALLAMGWRFSERLTETTRAAFSAVWAFSAAWFSVLWMILWGFYAGAYAYPAAALLVLGHIALGVRLRNPIVEVFGWLHFLVIAYGVALSMQAVESPRFPMQLLYAKIGMIAIALLLGLLQDFYRYALQDGGVGKRAAYVAREVFFWILPIALIDMSRQNLPEYWVVGLWAAAALAMALREFTQRATLIFLVHLVVLSATVLTLWQGSWLGAGMGVLLLWTWWAMGKAYDEAAYAQRRGDWALFALAGYFPALVLLRWYLVTFSAAESWLPVAGAGALLNFGFYFLSGQSWALAWRKAAAVHFRVGYAMLIVSFVWLAGFRSNADLLMHQFELFALGESKFLGLAFMALGVLSYIVYSRPQRLYPSEEGELWRVELILLQLFYVAFYAACVVKVFDTWQHAGLTVAAFLHAIALVFVALRPKYKLLVNIYIPLFALALLKLFFVDLARAETVVKIVVFIGLGLVFLGAAFAFIKFTKQKPEEKE